MPQSSESIDPAFIDPATNELRLALELAATEQIDLSSPTFATTVLPNLLHLVGSQVGGLVKQHRGTWACCPWVGDMTDVPTQLIGDVIDRSHSGTMSTQLSDGWCITAMPSNVQTSSTGNQLVASSALVVRLGEAELGDSSESNSRIRRITCAAELLATTLHRIETHQRQQRRIEQLSAVLASAAKWQRLDDDEKLLKEIADTATQLLRCERASIFLWDRRRSKLIGRPALGIKGSSLEVDDDAGVVGEVLRSGERKIWNAGSDDEARVNRKVDATLDFRTQSLVAVPMSRGQDENKRDELIGVFEAINRVDGDFDEFDAVLLADLATHAAVAIESLRTRRRLVESRDRLVNDAASSSPLVGNHESVENVRRSADKVANTDLSVLILGKNGTGKEVLARHVHYESKRRSGPFVAVNCAALVETLLESELFGHEKGAFTDANQTRVGKFELASGGTLFLDEVGDMSPGGQAKLLRVLEEKVVVRVGGSQPIPVDVRVIAATNQPLEELIRERRFREDLYFRLNVVSLTLPPLSQRGDDVMLLANHFLKQFCYQIGRQVPTWSEAAKSAMRNHPWPGNIRELRNTIERICYLTSDDIIKSDDLSLTGANINRDGGICRIDMPIELSESTKLFQVEHIERAIQSSGGNMTDAASRLGLHRSNLYRKMRQLGMPTSGE
ncbi:sigma-54-dependent Fis family transcriptional regulator [Rubripirellula reticaptiva]|uniref:Nitrogen fixation protein VnfA n=1 Tax=Rubripirellula reticaptiva TaxID=2528013 RepID=A0A5C6F9B7_9BACT|nr:sigma-54-dependent Fis family transcriptional regulator [Rubripirellula reticaptiva]TWU57985.1 Nitrogen fixation protein VnfA [Rubripirellula reticaptiva]